MKKTIFIFGLVALFFVPHLVGCGDTQTRTVKASGKYVTKEVKDLAPFTGIRLYGRPDVEFRQSKDGKTSVFISAPSNLADLVKITSQDQLLHVKIEARSKIVGKAKIRIIVTAPVLSSAEIIGSGGISILSPLKGKEIHFSIRGSGDLSTEQIECARMNLNIQGSGDMNFKKLTCQSLTVHIQGSGDVSVLGSAEEARFSVKGSGDISAKKCIVKDLKAEVSGSGDIACYPTQRLDAQVFGSGEITYVGAPKQITTSGNRNRIRKVK